MILLFPSQWRLAFAPFFVDSCIDFSIVEVSLGQRYTVPSTSYSIEGELIVSNVPSLHDFFAFLQQVKQGTHHLMVDVTLVLEPLHEAWVVQPSHHQTLQPLDPMHTEMESPLQPPPF